MFKKALKRYFLTGVLVLVPLAITLLVIQWLFGILDHWAVPLSNRLWGRHVPGLGFAITTLVILLVGIVASNVIGKWLVNLLDHVLLHIPILKGIYGVSKQIIDVLAPKGEGQGAFREVVLVEHPVRHTVVLGFVTQELSLRMHGRSSRRVAVYIPTNHMYLGDVFLFEPGKVQHAGLSVKEGIQCILSAGAAFPEHLPNKGTSK